MNLVLITTKNEIIKLILKNRTKFILMSEIFLCIFMAILGSQSIKLNISGFYISLPNLPFTLLPFFTTVFIPLIIFIFVADIFSSEFENNSIKSVLLRPVSRFKIFISKNLAVSFLIFVNLMIVFIVNITLQLIFRKEISSIHNALLSYFISIVPMIIFVLMASLIAQIINSPSLMMFTCIGIYIFLTAIKIVFSNISAALFVSYNTWYQMWIGSLVPFKMLLNTIFLLLSYIAIFFIVGFLIFDSKEV